MKWKSNKRHDGSAEYRLLQTLDSDNRSNIPKVSCIAIVRHLTEEYVNRQDALTWAWIDGNTGHWTVGFSTKKQAMEAAENYYKNILV